MLNLGCRFVAFSHARSLSGRPGRRRGMICGLMRTLTLTLSHRMGEGIAIGSNGLMVGCQTNAVTGFSSRWRIILPLLEGQVRASVNHKTEVRLKARQGMGPHPPLRVRPLPSPDGRGGGALLQERENAADFSGSGPGGEDDVVSLALAQ
jgi:hypothetical protein